MITAATPVPNKCAHWFDRTRIGRCGSCRTCRENPETAGQMTTNHRGLLRKEAEREQKISVSSAELLWLLNTVERFERHCGLAIARVREHQNRGQRGRNLPAPRAQAILLHEITEDIADALGDGSE